MIKRSYVNTDKIFNHEKTFRNPHAARPGQRQLY